MWDLGSLGFPLVLWMFSEIASAGMPPSRMRWWLLLGARVTAALLVVIWVLLLFA